MKCPYHKLKDSLVSIMTKRVAKLPVAESGYPTPFFIKYIDGKPEFRVVDEQRLIQCLRTNVCWVCGEPTGAFKSFLAGPMGYVNRICSDAFMHLDCAVFSVKACPHLNNPNAKRRKDDLTEHPNVGGILIEENPGVMAIYTTKSYQVKQDGNGILFHFGPAESVSWWSQGRSATSDELQRAFAMGAIKATSNCNEAETKRFTAKVRRELNQVLETL